MCCAVSHQNQHRILRQIRKLMCHSLDNSFAVCFRSQQRCTKPYTVKLFLISQCIFLHQIILDTIDHMRRLDDHITDSIGDHRLHRLAHIVDLLIFGAKKFFHYHFARPGRVEYPVRKGSRNIILDRCNISLACFRKTGAEADNQNRFCTFFRHKTLPKVLLHNFVQYIIFPVCVQLKMLKKCSYSKEACKV